MDLQSIMCAAISGCGILIFIAMVAGHFVSGVESRPAPTILRGDAGWIYETPDKPEPPEIVIVSGWGTVSTGKR